MKKYVFLIVLALIIGLSSGFVLRGALPSSRPSYPAPDLPSGDSSSPGSNTSLLLTATEVLEAIHSQNFSLLSSFADPNEGVTFTPFSTVDRSANVTLSAKDLSSAASNSDDYIWGVTVGGNEPVRLTISEFFSECLWDADFNSSSTIGVDTVLYSGNAVENVADAYPDCRFVDFYLPGQGADNENWFSLKLVFSRHHGEWYLIGVVHSEWTP